MICLSWELRKQRNGSWWSSHQLVVLSFFFAPHSSQISSHFFFTPNKDTVLVFTSFDMSSYIRFQICFKLFKWPTFRIGVRLDCLLCNQLLFGQDILEILVAWVGLVLALSALLKATVLVRISLFDSHCLCSWRETDLDWEGGWDLPIRAKYWIIKSMDPFRVGLRSLVLLRFWEPCHLRIVWESKREAEMSLILQNPLLSFRWQQLAIVLPITSIFLQAICRWLLINKRARLEVETSGLSIHSFDDWSLVCVRACAPFFMHQLLPVCPLLRKYVAVVLRLFRLQIYQFWVLEDLRVLAAVQASILSELHQLGVHSFPAARIDVYFIIFDLPRKKLHHLILRKLFSLPHDLSLGICESVGAGWLESGYFLIMLVFNYLF